MTLGEPLKEQESAVLSAFVLKIIAAAAMLTDHVAVAFFNSNYAMRATGRIAFPIFAYFIAEGYFRTRSVKKYAIRLFIFSLIAQAPYVLAFGSEIYKPNVIFTLFLGLIAVYVYDHGDNAFKIIVPLGIALLAELIGSDHGAFGVFMVIIFASTKDNKKKLLWASVLVIVMQATILLQYGSINMRYLMFLFYLLPMGLLYLYNGKKGAAGSFAKWFFYAFYPLHLFLIWLLKFFIK